MAQFKVGCVPYVNAVPLIWWFESLGKDSPVEVVYDVPSRLPALLESGDVQAILVSSVDALLTPGRTIVGGVCIGSQGSVRSVRLLSTVDFSEIKTLALDASSMTSNLLAQVLLKSVYGADPRVITLEPDPALMLSQADACVLIGDIGMTASYERAKVLDLGQAWTDWTGSPFVWAVWTGLTTLPAELADHLLAAFQQSHHSKGELRDEVIELGSVRSGWDRETVRDYLNGSIRFPFDQSALAGLTKFGASLVELGLTPAVADFPGNLLETSTSASLN